MRSKMIRMLALALLLCGISMATAQQPNTPPNFQVSGRLLKTPKQKTPPEKSKLEEMLAEALKNNPDIRVAAAKLAEADAELNRTRLQVIQKVVTTYHAIETQKKTIAHQEARCKELDRLRLSGAVSSTDYAEATQALTLAKGKLEELEAQLPALLGKTPQAENLQTYFQAKLLHEEAVRLSPQRWWTSIEEAVREKASKATGPMAERLRKALRTPVNVDYKKMHFPDILKDLAKKVPGLSIRNRFATGEFGIPPSAQDINLQFEEMLPVSAVLQALADECGCRFYVRQYGLMVTDKENAPPGGMTIEEFLRQKPVDQPRLRSSSGKNPPEKNVEGLVKSVDAKGLLTLSIGSDAWLVKGHTLELFRLDPSTPKQSKYLGTIRILDVQGRESIAQAVGRLADTPKTGDRVASRILGK